MPDFTTHHIFGQQVLTALSPAQKGAIEANFGAYCWGLQGPDLLYFHRHILAGSSLPQYGRTMHQLKTGALFEEFGRILVDRRQCQDYDIMRAYFFGFCCHYCLDSSVHPYVFSRQRDMEAGREMTDNRVHWELEAGIDDEIYQLVYGDDIRKFRVADYYKVNNDIKRAIALLYHLTLKNVYGLEASVKDLMACFDDGVWINNLLYDKLGCLRPAARLIQKLIGRDGQLTAHFKGGATDRDFLNLAHKPWPHIAESEAMHRESVPELMEEGKGLAISLIDCCDRAVSSGHWRLIGAFPFTKSFVHGRFR